MWHIARLLILERVRRLASQHGWVGYLSVSFVLILFGAAAAAAAAPSLKGASFDQLGRAWNYVWVAWIAMGALVGKDLSWQIRPERITLFPARGFFPIYSLRLALGFLSLPLLCVGGVFEALPMLRGPVSPRAFLVTLAAFALYAISVRLAVSLVRAGIFQLPSLRRASRAMLLSAIAALALLFAAAVPPWPPGRLLPGYQFAVAALGLATFGPLLRICAVAIPLALVDYVVQAELAYSGIRGPLASASRLLSRGSLLLLRPAWPGPLFGIALLGWLRNRNALLLLLWGAAYGFFYTWFSRPSESFYFFGFTWMVLIFHGYLRGNLLGIDRGGAWLYYMIPQPVARSLRAKNASLSVLQSVMVAAVFLPALFHPAAEMTATGWGRVVAYAVSAILLGEIAGSIFSVLQPDPIERGSQYSGGMTAGALLVPLIQLGFLAVFVLVSGLARHFLTALLFWSALAAFPLSLLAVRSLVLPRWIRRTMLRNPESLLQRLAVFSA